MNRLSHILLALLLASAAFAQDEDGAEPAPKPKKTRASALVDAVEADESEAPRPKTSTKPKAPKPAASPKPAKKPATKPTPKASPGSTKARTTKVEPIPDGALEALDQALAAYLTEKKAQPVVAQEPAAEGEELTVSIETLDQSLDAQMKKSSRQPATPPETRITKGLTALLETLGERGAAAGPGTPHTAALVPAPPDQGPALPNIPTIAPPPTATAVEPSPTAPETAPPPMGESPAPVPTPPPVELAPLATPARRYVLTRIAVSRDGGAEQELPIPQGGALRPVPLAHRGGNPSVEMKMLLRVPGEIGLSESTQVVAQASAQAAGVAAELSLADEVVDTGRAAEGAETTQAAGAVSYSFIKRVGGVYAYQQTFAQGDGRTPPAIPPRSILLNWTDRDATLEIPFAWVSTSPSAISLRGRLVYAPAK